MERAWGPGRCSASREASNFVYFSCGQCSNAGWTKAVPVENDFQTKVLMGINTMTFAARHYWRRRGSPQSGPLLICSDWSDEHTRAGPVRSEQRSLRQKGLPPGGLRCFWPGASLLVGCSPTLGDAPSSSQNIQELPALAGCPAPGQKQCNERHRIYARQH
jgi:hypothetical protein